MSSNPKDKKYLVALLIVLGGMLVFSVVLGLIAVQFVRLSALRTSAATPGPSRAAVDLIIPGDFRKDFSISTVVNVPLPEGIYSEPSLQFTAYDPVGRASWEAGIIHARKYGYRLASYVGESLPSQRYRLVYLPPISDGPHRMGLSRSGSRLRFFIDNRPVYTFADAAGLEKATLRLWIGTSIGRSGEIASGSFSDLRIVESEAASERSHRPRCTVSWGGIALVPKGSRWVLEGRSDPSELGHRVERCHTES